MTNTYPRHIGYIVDGNRRWAKEHGLPTYEGHLAGYNAIIEVVLATFNAGIPYVSIYAFSTENWKRSEEEVKKLMTLALKLLISDITILEKNDIKLKILGSKEGISDKILKAINIAEERTRNNTHGTLAVCFNYGGQLEIVEACKKIIQSGISSQTITLDSIQDYLYAPEIPSIDLIVRTSGEKRLSNFMLWRAAYSEFLFLEKTWPDMTKDDVTAILEEYAQRGRRFGG